MEIVRPRALDERNPMDDVSSAGAGSVDHPVWVREWRSVHLGWSAAALGLSLSLVALFATAIVSREMLRPSVVVWISAAAYFLIAFLGLAVMVSGLGSVRLSRFVRSIQVEGVGAGLAVPGRGDVMMRAMVLLLALVLFLLHLVVRHDTPDPRQAKLELLTLVGAPACLAFFVWGFVVVDRTRISLHPAGIVQVLHRRRARRVTNEVTLVRWEDVGDLRLVANPNPAQPSAQLLPVVRVASRSDRSTEVDLVIMACEKKVEPNSLLALLRWCRDNPWAREQLGGEDARELLRPPRLLDRMKADRDRALADREQSTAIRRGGR